MANLNSRRISELDGDKKTLVLDGNSLLVESVCFFVSEYRDGSLVRVSDKIEDAVLRSRKFLEEEMGRRVIYGVNTGFGPMASYIIGADKLFELQENLIRSHAVGMGDPVKSEYVLAAMIIRLNTLTKGYAGVSADLIKHFERFINSGAVPIVPEHGAVGTSGDLVQLAHIALSLIGEGEVWYEGERMPTRGILSRAGLPVYRLKPKEGLSLINGTSFMAGVGVFACSFAFRAISVAVRAGALALELVDGYKDGISEKLHSLRPHRGQEAVARVLRSITESSLLLRDRNELAGVSNGNGSHKISDWVQEVYSIRCIPQILGPVLDSIERTKVCLETEMNSVTDNPIVDWEGGGFLHGGNFHGEYVSAVLDDMKASMVKLAMLSERRTNFFLNDKANKHFPPFLNLDQPGLTLGLQGLQFVATSTVAHSQSLAFPHRAHSIPTNADNQDVVSMGADSALFTMKVLDDVFIVLAIELVTLAQVVDARGAQDKLSDESRKLFDMTRAVFPVIRNDREIHGELAFVVDFLKKNKSLDVLWGARI